MKILVDVTLNQDVEDILERLKEASDILYDCYHKLTAMGALSIKEEGRDDKGSAQCQTNVNE